jgi:hypothetical protein
MNIKFCQKISRKETTLESYVETHDITKMNLGETRHENMDQIQLATDGSTHR